MAKTNHKSPLATSYATSVLELANEKKQAESIGQELSALGQVVSENKTFRLFLSDPGISETERAEMLKKILGSNLSPLMHNVLGVMNQKNRLGILPDVAATYAELLDEQLGKIEVDVTVAKKLSNEQLEEVRKRVSSALKKDAVVHQTVDESIIGGLIVRVRDKLIDASVKTQLAAMREQLLAARTK